MRTQDPDDLGGDVRIHKVAGLTRHGAPLHLKVTLSRAADIHPYVTICAYLSLDTARRARARPARRLPGPLHRHFPTDIRYAVTFLNDEKNKERSPCTTAEPSSPPLSELPPPPSPCPPAAARAARAAPRAAPSASPCRPRPPSAGSPTARAS